MICDRLTILLERFLLRTHSFSGFDVCAARECSLHIVGVVVLAKIEWMLTVRRHKFDTQSLHEIVVIVVPLCMCEPIFAISFGRTSNVCSSKPTRYRARLLVVSVSASGGEFGSGVVFFSSRSFSRTALEYIHFWLQCSNWMGGSKCERNIFI